MSKNTTARDSALQQLRSLLELAREAEPLLPPVAETDPYYGGSEGDRWSVQCLVGTIDGDGHKVLGVFEDLADALAAMANYLLRGGPWAGCANKPVLRLVREQACLGITPVGGLVMSSANPDDADDLAEDEQEPAQADDWVSISTPESGQCCQCGRDGLMVAIRRGEDERLICKPCLLAYKDSE